MSSPEHIDNKEGIFANINIFIAFMTITGHVWETK